MKHSEVSFDHELEIMQKQTFQYFHNETNLSNGLIIDKNAENWPSSIAATGLGLAVYAVGVQRGFISRQSAVKRILTTLRFFWNSPQGPEPDATGYKGFYYHFLDMKTGRRAWECELSTVDTAFLIAGMLLARLYFNENNPEENELRQLAEDLYKRVDWDWARDNGATLTHGWKPETGFLVFRWEGYDEALLLYILALGSPTHPISEDSYAAWLKTYSWENHYGYEYVYAGSFFTHQLSHMWIDFRGIKDAFMREKGIDYFENSRRATFVQQLYAIENPNNFIGYCECCWGITASDGPGPGFYKVDGVEHYFYDYIARGVPYGPDDGTIAPWSVVASLPFAPEIVIQTLDHYIYTLKLKDYPYGFRATFNQSHPEKSHPCGWVSPYHFGINEGPIILMIENYRTQMLWKLTKTCEFFNNGLRRAGFKGGWLDGTD